MAEEMAGAHGTAHYRSACIAVEGQVPASLGKGETGDLIAPLSSPS